ncbi:MAG: malto-oligosyltrehalose synthase [Gammaproteobacteria bacterium]|nr:malto-oligosyltrehalose synthase [Rhodocyclaceae bacterium]MBU3908557.1 malto-oligosyltrehalose synthase [Gammaproteobacteria bacterium]MBU3990297.1 malto-oligosyltrehalose synthase [Gammaproteobacteria bacterium]MBU4004585.1 malto-oligosyltrehalose synthase [Gammaproteobacteria bacterium]MBU4021188.1 malto-oligosyltrehalose synthase [Gammaproteobacteria bacterium]
MTRPARSSSDALVQLAAHCGIATEYRDIWNKRHATTDATRRALLAAMHFPTEADPATLLREMEQREWRRPLPPVMVLRVDATPAIPLTLSAALIQQRYRWILTREDGTTTTEEFFPADLLRIQDQRLDGVEFQRMELKLPPFTTPGYYRVEVEQPGHEVQPQAAMTLIIAPRTCYQPAAISGENRAWGPSVQLYGLRSQRNWGIGDFGDLRTLVDLTAESGGGVVGVNPLHALFPDDPGRISPYSPSNRCFVNFLYLDVEAVPEFSECGTARDLVASERFQARLRRLRASELVSYPEVAGAKREVLALLHHHFRDHHLVNDSDRARAFRRFREEGGEALERHARFEALQAHFRRENPGVWGWPAWPEEYRQPEAPAVAAFATEHAAAVEFFAWLQWLADEQLATVGLQSWRHGLGVGLYQDMALGMHPGGSEAWSWQNAFAAGAYAGAPPDDVNPFGQDWGLPPFVPHHLREAAYAPFIAVMRANMRHCGALRIDHAMALTRVFWVPAGLSPEQGTYVAYPLDDLLGILALESQRNHCLVIGEDLGTVPAGFRTRLIETGILSYRPFLFERTTDGSFKPPADYPQQALVAVSTHDLPTLRGFWKGDDLDTRASLQLFPSTEQRDQRVMERAQDRARFLMALEREGLLPAGVGVHPVSMPDITLPFVVAIHTYLARTPAQLLLVQPEDILGIVEQTNLPGSRDDQHANWRRRLPLDLEDWRNDSRFTTVGEALRRERGSAVAPHDEEPPAPRLAVIPRATYRLQFNNEFTFAQATTLAPYLADLGVSHCYASPYLKARAGSGHGYDIVDHAALNPEIGSPQDYDNFVAALKAHDLGQILDVVPNHMGIMGADNAWWLDVLENGPASAWGNFFDIDWEPLNPILRGKVLLPLLGDHYGTVLNRGEFRLEYDAAHGEFSIFYYQHRLPVDPASYPHIVGHHSEHLAITLGENDERYIELQTLLTAFGHLPARTDTNAARMGERQRDKEVHKRHLAALSESCADIAHHITENLTEFNGQPGNESSFDLLHELIQQQGYRLAFWRVASDEINYRRFFDINDLAALRMDEPAVFEATHRFVLDLLAQGKIEGLRIDHPDGLYDPGRYFRRLQEVAGGKPLAADDPLPLYLVIEKILAEHERLPDDWPIHGATGYRFANLANNLFVDTAAERRMTRIYHDFSGAADDFDTLAYEAKKLIMRTALSSELNVLATRLARIATASRDTCDFTLNGLRDALVEVVACFPVYRSYVAHGQLSADDRRHIAWAVAVAKKRSPAADTGIHDFLQDVLTTDIARGRSASFRERVQAFAMKFQQFSSPVMAKGVEDTAFYRYHRLTSLNDVGGEPRRFGISVAAFHAATRARAARWPHNLLATSTHDSKRSEDVRARINVLSEMPAAWKLMLRRWSRWSRSRKRVVDGVEAPSRNDEYLLYQTLLGTWPLMLPDEAALADYRARIEAYMIKALREGKEHSSWVNVNTEYEAAMSSFVQALLAPGEKNLFLADFVPIAQPIARHGLINSLAQALVKLVSPGVPDIYQGCELWQFNLVDPDNRRPIDFVRRNELLAEVKALVDAPPAQWPQRLQPLVTNMADGRIKLYTHWQSLSLRARWPEVFRDGDYLPLTVSGAGAMHACAFARRHAGRTLIALVPRLPARLLGDHHALPLGAEVWGDTAIELPDDLAELEWDNALTGEHHPASRNLALGQLLNCFPVALLVAENHA